jgi:hypothetical protein
MRFAELADERSARLIHIHAGVYAGAGAFSTRKFPGDHVMTSRPGIGQVRPISGTFEPDVT